MKKIFILLFILTFSFSSLNAEKKCDAKESKINPACSKILKGTSTILKGTGNKVNGFFEGMKNFSKKHQTIGQTLNIGQDKKVKKKSLKEFSKDHNTIKGTLKVLKEKK